MNKLSRLPRSRSLRALARDTRGASMVEYALLLTLVMVGVSPVVRSLGEVVTRAFRVTLEQFGP